MTRQRRHYQRPTVAASPMAMKRSRTGPETDPPPVLITALPQMEQSAHRLQHVEGEAHAMQENFGGAERAEVLLNISIETFANALGARTTWCFAGHGDALLAGQNVLAFVDPASGGLQAVSIESLVATVLPSVVDEKLRLVVFTGCCTLSLAMALRERALVPYIVCWETRVEDQAASIFGSAFAGSIAAGKSPSEAFESACAAVRRVTEQGCLDNGISAAVQKYELVDPDDRVNVRSGRLRNFAPAARKGRVAAGVPRLLQPDDNKISGVPPLPAVFLPRPEQHSMRHALLRGNREPGVVVGIVGSSSTAGSSSATSLAPSGCVSGIAGTAGLGKTTTAIWLVRDVCVRIAFHDGIFWLEFGKDRTAVEMLVRFLIKLGMSLPDVESCKGLGEDALCEVACQRAQGKHFLIVLDDIWHDDQPEPFRQLAGGSVTVLMTTRKTHIVEIYGKELALVSLHPFDDVNSAQLLISSSGKEQSEFDAKQLEELVRLCAGLPAMLRSVGRMCAKMGLEEVLVFFRSHKLQHSIPADMARADGYQQRAAKGNLFLAYEGQLDMLAAASEAGALLVARCTSLAVFREDDNIALNALMGLWDISREEASIVVAQLVKENLVEPREAGAIVITDPVRDYLRCRGKSDLARWHMELLERCQTDNIQFTYAGMNSMHNEFDADSARRFQEQDYWKGPMTLMYHLKQFSGTRYELSRNALRSVKEVDLQYNSICDAGMKILSDAWAAGAMLQLERLDLGANNISPTGIRSFAAALAKGGLHGLRHLSFGDEVADNAVGDAGVEILVKACSQHGCLANLEELSLWNNGITDVGTQAFGQFCGPDVLPSLSALMLNDNPITLAGMSAMAEACSNGALPSLQILALDYEGFGEAAAHPKECLRARGIRCSFFSDEPIVLDDNRPIVFD